MRTRLSFSLGVLDVAVAVLMANCGAAAQQPQGPPPSKFMVMSSAFADGAKIPTQYSCADPKATSPELRWINPPAGTVSFALIMHDPDGAPQRSSIDVTHWLIWNIPASSTSLSANIKPDSSPDGIIQGKNVRNVNGYRGPCPPPGAASHHYTFELYALDIKIDLPAGASRADLLKAMDGHVIGKTAYIGLFRG
jgi:Raf kinase inhibitor-like YbhB/YbcL family protein